MSPKLLSSADTVITTAILKCRDDLGGRLRAKLRDMASKSQSGLGSAWLEMLTWYKVELLVRASVVTNAYKKAVEAESTPVKNGRLESLLATVQARIEAEFSILSAEAEGFFNSHRHNTHWFIPSLREEGTRVLGNTIETLRLDLETLHQTKSATSVKKEILVGVTIGVILALFGLGLKFSEKRDATPRDSAVVTAKR